MKSITGALGIVITLLAIVLPAAAQPGFYVDGRFLYDKCGEKTILRGSNVMTAYWDHGGATTMPQLSQTGANVARIFWRADDDYLDATHLDLVITNCIDNNMIPMVGLWDATGEWALLQSCVDYWTRPDILAVVQEHEEYFLLNIANEAGNGSQSDTVWRTAYEAAITQLRNAGIVCPLVIDAGQWGRGEQYIMNNAQYLVNADPLQSLIFSWHPWDPISGGGTQARIKKAIDDSIALNICFIIGEFSHLDVFYDQPIEWQYIMTYGHQNEIGWLPWVWQCCGGTGDGHSITTDKIYGHWHNAPWGEQVAVAHQYSIANTAVRPQSIVRGYCGEPTYTASEPSPDADATNVPTNTELSWRSGHGATSHDVYFGTSNPPPFADNVTQTSFDPCTLDYDTTYYWAVDEINDTEIFQGPVWSFTTVAYDPNIAFDNASSILVTSGSTISFSHTIGAGEDRILVVGAAGEDNTAADMVITGVTYNGAAMTPVTGSQAVASTTGSSTLQKSELYYMLETDLPPAGTYTVVVSYAGAMDQASGGAVSLLHAAQEPPEAVVTNNNSGQTSISTSITTETDNAWVVDVIGSGNTGTFVAAAAGMVRRWYTSDFTSAAAASTTPVPAAGPVTISWNNSGANRLAHSVAAIAPAARICPLGDLDGQCDVDWDDMRIFADQWLNTGDCSAEPGCADLDDSMDVDFVDFALMGENWGS